MRNSTVSRCGTLGLDGSDVTVAPGALSTQEAAHHCGDRLAMDKLGEEALLALEIGVDERVVRVASVVGCTLVLTDRRLVLVRDGASYRPKTGVQSWPVDRHLNLHVTRMRRDTGRLLIGPTDGSVSVFVTNAQLPEVRAIIADVRQRAYAEQGTG